MTVPFSRANERDVWVFDLDDTLYPERDYVLSGFQALDEWTQHEFGIKGFSKHCEKLFQTGQRGTIFNRALEISGIEPTASIISQLVSTYRAHTPTLTLFLDAQHLLKHRLSGKRFGLITDGYFEVQKAKVAALGIDTHMDALVYSDALGREHWKPSQAPYHAIEAQLDVEGARCLYIGDNPVKDFFGARARGWLTIRLRREGTEHSGKEATPEQAADIEINSLNELLP